MNKHIMKYKWYDYAIFFGGGSAIGAGLIIAVAWIVWMVIG